MLCHFIDWSIGTHICTPIAIFTWFTDNQKPHFWYGVGFVMGLLKMAWETQLYIHFSEVRFLQFEALACQPSICDKWVCFFKLNLQNYVSVVYRCTEYFIYVLCYMNSISCIKRQSHYHHCMSYLLIVDHVLQRGFYIKYNRQPFGLPCDLICFTVLSCSILI